MKLVKKLFFLGFDQAGPNVDISDTEKGNEDTYSERAIDVPANFIEEKLSKNQEPKNFNNAKQRFLSSVRYENV